MSDKDLVKDCADNNLQSSSVESEFHPGNEHSQKIDENKFLADSDDKSVHSVNSRNEDALLEITSDDKTPRSVLRNQPSYNINNILNLGIESETAEDTPRKNSTKNRTDDCGGTNSEKSKCRARMLRKKVKNSKKRKWRPLWKLTNKERKKVYEREIRRVHQDQDLLINAGAALAPHNTSDFIIRDHFGSPPNDDEINDSFQVETEVVTYDKEFEEVYESMHMNYFEKLSKYELVERYIETEDRIEVLEKRLKAMRERKRLLGLRGIDVDSEMTKIEVFKDEINKLIEQNDDLYEKNEKIKNILMALTN